MLLISCASIQTKPTCRGTDYVAPYSVINIINHTDRYHIGGYCKLDSANVCEKQIVFGIPEFPATSLRLVPGDYQIAFRILRGYKYIVKVYEFSVEVCTTDILFEIK